MPINPKLKTYLTGITMDDAYRTKLIDTLEDAPPEVQNAWMANDDYTRQVNAHKKDVDEWKAKNKEFYDKSNTAVEAWKSERDKALEAVTAAQARITELETAGGPSRTPGEEDAVAKEVKELKTAIAGVTEKLGKVVTEEHLNTAYQNAVGFMGEQTIKLRKIEKIHEKTFGTEFTEEDTLALIKFANEKSAELGHRIPLDEAYKMQRAEDISKKHDEQVANEAVEKYKSTNLIPGAEGPGAPGPTGKGPLELRLEQERNRASGGKGDTGYATWQEAAAAAGQELVKEGKY